VEPKRKRGSALHYHWFIKHNDQTTMNRFSLALSSILSLSAAKAAEPGPVIFNHFDWEIVCDNTRTCRAAGYQPDDQDDQHHYFGASVLLTRAAGPNAAVDAALQVAPADEAPNRVTMHIDGRVLGGVELKDGGGRLNAAQTQALLAAILKSSNIRWTARQREYLLSTTGASAVLLKMDEFQGRLGTPGALVRKRTRAEASVLPAITIPSVKAARVSNDEIDPQLLTVPLRRSLLAELRHTVVTKNGNECPAFDEGMPQPKDLDIRQLSRQRLLVSLTCWTAAYNSGDAYWLVNAAPPYSPVLLTDKGSDYDKGVLTSHQRGRGIGDCGNSDTWTWDGGAFIRTSAEISQLCKSFPGGAWNMPSLVTKLESQK
jgi:hypothetical protein